MTELSDTHKCFIKTLEHLVDVLNGMSDEEFERRLRESKAPQAQIDFFDKWLNNKEVGNKNV